jgi:hypothetical protein
VAVRDMRGIFHQFSLERKKSQYVDYQSSKLDMAKSLVALKIALAISRCFPVSTVLVMDNVPEKI